MVVYDSSIVQSMNEKNPVLQPQFEPVAGTATPMTQEEFKNVARGVVDVLPNEEFFKKLEHGERMRFYVGADPSRPDLHIGHAVVLRFLAQMQELGHEVIFLIGDFTARIGDPTGKDTARIALTPAEVLQNAETYKHQVEKIIHFGETHSNPAKLLFNSEWLDALNFADVIQLASEFTVQQMLERDMFENRLKEGRPIFVHEFFYPIMQGYDSVAMNVDVEIGGTDQLFNMLAGRSLMKTATGREKIVMTFELLLGLDGRKMSKSYDNYIGVTDAPNDMYGKVMALADELIPMYWRLCTAMPVEDIAIIEDGLKSGALNPRDEKMKLAHAVVAVYYGAETATAAQEEFVNVFQKKEKPADIETKEVNGSDWNIVDLIAVVSFAASKSEARRLVEQGGVRINDQKKEDINEVAQIQTGDLLQVGKRKFARLVVV